MIKVIKYNESHLRVICDRDEANNISEYFAFYTPGYQWSPKYKAGIWDGRIYLFNYKTGLLPLGLAPRLLKFFKTYKFDYELLDGIKEEGYKLSAKNILKFCKMIKTPFAPRDYQIRSIQELAWRKKASILSATGSGKSFVAYILFNILKYFDEENKFLLLVPTTSLVEQMAGDFQEYAENWCDYSQYVHKIYAGKEKESDKPIIISTWQSLQKLPKRYFSQFSVVKCDEVHVAQAPVLSKIMEYCSHAGFKFGMTGTVDDDSKIHKLQLEGLFGPLMRMSRTKELIDRGYLAKFKIKGIILEYPEHVRKAMKGFDYDSEVEILRGFKSRQIFISKLALSRKGNSLVLFRSIEHGKKLYKWIGNNMDGEKVRSVHYIDGSVKAEQRERIRKWAEDHDGVVIVASYGTYSTGINIKNLHNIIFAESMASQIKVIQSIGRSLRVHANKDHATLYDVTDDMSWKKRKNYVLKHFIKRTSFYDKEKFRYTIKSVKMSK